MPSRILNAPRAAFAVALAGSIAITWSQSPLAYDGSAILLRTVHHRAPFVTHNRWVTWIVKLPAALAVTVTNSMSVARFVFSLAYALLPVVAAVLAWLVVRRDAPHLAFWAALGIFLLPMPGLVFATSEAETIVQLAWPLLLLTLLGLRTRGRQLAAGALVAVMVTMHPFAVVLLTMIGVVAGIGALLRRVPRLPALVSCIAMLTVAAARYLTLDPYERTQTTEESLRSAFRRAVEGLPLRALVLAGVAAVAVVVLRRARKVPAPLPLIVVVGPLLAALGVLAWWGADVTRWADASGYRGWVLLLSLPLYVLAVADAWLPAPAPGPAGSPAVWNAMAAGGVVCACVFALTSLLQGIGWHRLTRELERNVAQARTVCTTRAAVMPRDRGPLYSWATNSLALVLQSRAPKHIVLDDAADCAAFQRGARPAVVGHDRILKPLHGWIRLPAPPP